MAEPGVSVVVPVHAGERFLPAALDSVAGQTHPPLETIVVDDGSPDASAALAADRAGVRVVRQEHAGVAAARNAGARLARGTLLAFLDQDDLWHPEKLARQVVALDAAPQAAVALCHAHMVLDPGVPQPDWFPDEWLTEPQAGWIPSAWLVRREAFDRVGPFDEGYEIACDSDWLARLKDLGMSTTMLDEPLLRWRVHGANGSYDRTTMQRELVEVLRRSVRRQREGARAG
jgi:glycosyltransferase involved in cell wall biosynthesis